MKSLPINWFDAAVLVLLLIGLQRGRKRGMSEEFLTSLMWLTIVVACAWAYEPLGQLLTGMSPFSRLFSFILCYIAVGLAVAGVFLFLKRTVGGKLIGSDTFGSAEYYLGMPAGMVRFACILIAALALLNARQYRSEEIQAMAKFQNDNYGSQFFPGLHTVQAEVFEHSLTGPPIKKYMGFLLIKPTPPESRPIRRAQETKLP
ncbi:MAG: CvpA family protein [Verrucomicrobiae bacterium]|nr:CvpA family protein [Verrucomicrobiae bacterium]